MIYSRKHRRYDIPASPDPDVNVGDIQTLPDGTRWIVADIIGHGIGPDGMISQYRITLVPATKLAVKAVHDRERNM